MSAVAESKRITVPEIMAHKGGTPLVCLTCYDAVLAKIMDPQVDLILIGDTVGMVVHGMKTTLPVTLEMMILHAQGVMRGSSHALVAVDMPFGSYEESPAQAFRNAARVLAETGAQAVKLEGGVRMAETVRFLTCRGIPVVGHVGLTPQSIQALGGFKAQGREEAQWPAIEEDARGVAEAGAFAVVLEAMAEPLAAKITRQIPVPTIGIGASNACDGQILVVNDMLGLTPHVPKFVRRYAHLGEDVAAAVASYAADVRARAFPGADNTYAMKKAGPAQ
jgi:3-methyl-2-oxobutanoate hydroxymethyltransferase